jgi:regulator of protease activity HflC (stomatin/prohibitin superfamily)
MGRYLFFLTAEVKDDERAFLSRNGRFERVLDPGLHRIFDPAHAYTVEFFKVVGTTFPMDRIRLLQSVAPDVVERYFVVAAAKPDEIVFVMLDGETKFYATPRNPSAYWKCVSRVETDTVSVKETNRADLLVAERHGVTRAAIVLDSQIESYEAGLLYVDGVLTEKLAPGRHMFWQLLRKIEVRKFDLRPQPLEVTAQEILTKDRIGLRITLTAFWRIVDPERVALAAADLPNLIYRLIQFAIREVVVTRTLDEILGARDAIDSEIRSYVSARAPDLGIAIGEFGLKDVILPGDVRALLNKVVEADRTARANLIRRQEETAATRSLLNTARLMENNPTLLRLKELESLERLVEKVGRIDLHAGPGLSAFEPLLKGLYRLDPDAGSASGGERGSGASDDVPTP